jgi:hypothetical protein
LASVIPGLDKGPSMTEFMSDSVKRTSARDQDRGKGAVEQDGPQQPGNTSLHGQLGHRDQDPLLKSSDTDFPEPGENPEHTGEPKKGNLDDVA